MNKKITIVAAIFVIAVGAFMLLGRKKAVAPVELLETASSTPEEKAPPLTDTEKEIKSEAWAVFEQYVAAAKKHDLEGVKSLSYKLSTICQDSSKRAQCNELMDNVAYFADFIKKPQLTVVLSDKKQVILASKYMEFNQALAIGYQRQIMYFIRSGDSIKLLSLNPADGYILRTSGVATSTAEAKFPSLSKDTDGDGLSDIAENCDSDILQYCIKSNPDKKDTDGNGFWDSIDLILKQKQ